MRKLVVVLCIAAGLLAPRSGSAATLLVSPYAPAEAVVSLDVTGAQVRYRAADDRFYVERNIESLSWGYGSFFASAGYVSKTEFEDFEVAKFDDDEAGYVLALGARGQVWRQGEFSAALHAQFHTLNEKVLIDETSYDLQSIELLAGADAVWTPGTWSLYAGVQVVPYSDIELDYFENNQVERTDFILVRVGGRVPLGRMSLDFELPFIGAEGVRLGLSYAF